jgi:hypothetical protein
MSAIESPEQLVEVIRLSELIDEYQLQRALQDFDNKGLESTADQLARFLIDCGLLTRWQADKLREKKYKGFFIGPYVIIYRRETSTEFTRYLVRHSATGRHLVMRVAAEKSSYYSTGELKYEIEDLD